LGDAKVLSLTDPQALAAATESRTGCQTWASRSNGRCKIGDDGSPLRHLTKGQIRDLLGKGWLTHDGMWFVNAAAALGIDKANALNWAAIRSMSKIEVGRLVETLGVDPGGPMTADDVCRLLTDGFALLLPDSVSSRMRVSATDPATVRLEWDDGECFAYKGMKRAGMLDGYECGVIYRIECWLEVLDIGYEVDPPTGLCRMRLNGACVTDIHFVSELRRPLISTDQ